MRRSILSLLFAAFALAANAPAQDVGVAQFAGRVIDADTQAPVDGARVELWDQTPVRPDHPSHMQPKRLVTGADGKFAFDLPSFGGRYRIVVQLTGFSPPIDGTNARLWDLAAGQSITDLVAKLRLGGTISGRVVTDAGAPMSDVMVSALLVGAKPVQLATYFAHTDLRGAFRLTAISPGNYILRATPRGYRQPIDEATGISTYYPLTVIRDSAQVITVGRGTVAAGLQVKLASGTSFQITGVVVDERGAPIQGAGFKMVCDDGGPMLIYVNTGPDGSFHVFGAVSGTYTVMAGLPGSETSDASSTPDKVTVVDHDLKDVRLVLRSLRGDTPLSSDRIANVEQLDQSSLAPPPKNSQWLKLFEGKSTDKLTADPRFKPFMQQTLGKVRMTLGGRQSAPDSIMEFLGVPETVSVEDHRFVTATGCVSHFCPNRGMLWVDTHEDASGPIVVFVAVEGVAPNVSLSLYSNRDFYNDPSSLPHNLLLNINKWVRAPVKPVLRLGRATIMDTSGQNGKEVAPEALNIPLSRWQAEITP